MPRYETQVSFSFVPCSAAERNGHIYEFALDRNLIDYMYNNISYNNLIDRDEYCNDTAISFPVRRICRLNELTTIDIIKEYGIMLSRIGQPFDFYK